MSEGRTRAQRMMGVVVGLALLAASASIAADGTVDAILKLKAGTCQFRLLNSKGVVPLANASLSLAAAENGASVGKVTTADDGKCQMEIAAGRYVLAVNGMQMAVVEASAENTLADCRIIVPEAPLQVGGQADAPPEEQKRRFLVLPSGKTAVLMAIGGAAVAGGAIWGHNENWGRTTQTEKREKAASRQLAQLRQTLAAAGITEAQYQQMLQDPTLQATLQQLQAGQAVSAPDLQRLVADAGTRRTSGGGTGGGRGIPPSPPKPSSP